MFWVLFFGAAGAALGYGSAQWFLAGASPWAALALTLIPAGVACLWAGHVLAKRQAAAAAAMEQVVGVDAFRRAGIALAAGQQPAASSSSDFVDPNYAPPLPGAGVPDPIQSELHGVLTDVNGRVV